MLKASAKLDDGAFLIVLGLSDGNVERLRQDEPILFSLAELGVGNGFVCISWKHDDGMAGFPKDFYGIGLILSDKALEAMKQHPLEMPYGRKLKFLLFRGETEQKMEEELHGLISPQTKVTHKGYAPTDVPPGSN